jgi:two-component system OmpR family response regulator
MTSFCHKCPQINAYDLYMADFPRILIVDDDREIRELLSTFLEKHGYTIATAADGVAMHQQLAVDPPDLIVLDIMLPGEDGLSLCRQLRASSTVPIIMVTAIDEDMDRIIGLEMGADDYVTKPFNPRELLARIKAVLRRVDYSQVTAEQTQAPTVGTTQFAFADWVLDLGRRELRNAASGERGTLISLTAGEFDLLLAFVEHPQRVLSRDQLLEYTKGYGAVGFDRSIDVQLSRLRRKIEPNPKEPVLIKTVRGGGYLFTPTVQRVGP